MQKSPLKSADFIKTVIEAALKKLTLGRDHLRAVKKEAASNEELKQKYHFNALSVSIKDEPFTVDATRIPGTQFIAAAGPLNRADVEKFINNTAYHSTDPVFDIVALGDCLAYDGGITYQDFHDYCLQPAEADACGEFTVTVRRVSGETTSASRSRQIFPQGIVQSQLHIMRANEQKNLNVTVFELRDNFPLNLGAYAESTDTVHNLKISKQALIEIRKEAMWQIYEKSLTNRIWVHCAGGIGRTGHFILIMEIMKSYTEIFNNDDAAVCADKILAILDNMRRVRPGLVYTKDQFVGAILNADILFRYSLERTKRYTIEFGCFGLSYTLSCWADLIKFIADLKNHEDSDDITRPTYINLFKVTDFAKFINIILTDVNPIASPEFNSLQCFFDQYCTKCSADRLLPLLKSFLEYDRAFDSLIAKSTFNFDTLKSVDLKTYDLIMSKKSTAPLVSTTELQSDFSLK